ncbi:MAG: type IV pilin protein [Gammaproteobacteria bacterium]|nr:type IV pilin protein [Gammaproteobacteria bacterium]
MYKINGFTLIELMIVVAIIGILAAIAYPSYLDQVRKTRRANAQSDLVELASFMERYYTEKFTYMNGGVAPILPFTESPKDGGGAKYYDLTVATTATAFTLTATAKNGQQADTCGDMTITQSGVQTPAACW